MLDDTAELERSVIGLALMSPRSLRDMDALAPDHFAVELHAEAWRVIRDMDQGGAAITPTTFKANLGRLGGHVRRNATTDWIAGCLHAAPVDVLAETHARLVVNASKLRDLGVALERSNQVYEAATDATEAIETVRGELDAIAPATVGGSMLADHLLASVAAFDEPNRAVPTPWIGLNAIIGGWRPGGLYVIGSRPGAGKTLWGVQTALHMAHRGPVAFNSLEMSRHEVNQRLIAHAANVHIGRLQGTRNGRPNLDANDRALIGEAVTELVDLPLSIRDDRSVTVTGIRAHARSLSRRGPLAGIVVDYLQLLRSERSDKRPRHEIVADYSRALKNLAGEMDCPVIALSQLNRGAAGAPASLANLRESGALEQDADVVILLSIPEDKDENGNPIIDEDHLAVDIAKNRHGPPGAITLRRDGAHATLGDRTEIEPPERTA